DNLPVMLHQCVLKRLQRGTAGWLLAPRENGLARARCSVSWPVARKLAQCAIQHERSQCFDVGLARDRIDAAHEIEFALRARYIVVSPASTARHLSECRQRAGVVGLTECFLHRSIHLTARVSEQMHEVIGRTAVMHHPESAGG